MTIDKDLAACMPSVLLDYLAPKIIFRPGVFNHQTANFTNALGLNSDISYNRTIRVLKCTERIVL